MSAAVPGCNSHGTRATGPRPHDALRIRWGRFRKHPIATRSIAQGFTAALVRAIFWAPEGNSSHHDEERNYIRYESQREALRSEEDR